MTVNTLDRLPPPLLGVLFAEDFDLPLASDRQGQLSVEPQVIDKQPAPDVEVIRREAFALGRASATAEIDADRRRRDEATRALLQVIAVELGRGVVEHARAVEAGAEIVARLLLGMLAAALPALCARHGANEVAAVARNVLPALVHMPKVIIRVSADALTGLQSELARLDPEFQSRIALIPSDAIPDGDIRLSWQDGCATRETARIWRAICETLAPLGLLDTRPTCDAIQQG